VGLSCLPAVTVAVIVLEIKKVLKIRIRDSSQGTIKQNCKIVRRKAQTKMPFNVIICSKYKKP
jgi:hypothetical protein